MARIAGVDLPQTKRIEIGLTYIYGIGRKRSTDILDAAGVDASVRVKDLSEDDVRTILSAPDVLVGSDGTSLAPYGVTAQGKPHPRFYGTFARVLGHYVREERVLSLEDAVRKMTSLPAQILGLSDRGQIREGFVADIAIFDPATVRHTNSFENPKSYAEGVHYTIVNGVLVIDGGKHTGARPGRPLLGRGHKQSVPTP